MNMTDTRKTLEELIRSRGEDYRSISRLLGRNAAYIQQFIHRGIPRKLDEDDRRTLASYFNVDESILGGPISTKSHKFAGFTLPNGDSLVVVPRLAIDASAGPGGHVDEESIAGAIAFDPKWLRKYNVRPQGVSMIQVQGDSMQPTLNAGDDIMVDRDDAQDRLRDGIYVLRADGTLLVKRLAVNAATRGFIIRSDNPTYPDWTDIDLSQIDVIGRVVWVGRKVG
jgi:phage repressor protein C with HTH and peptisase S24 domain